MKIWTITNWNNIIGSNILYIVEVIEELGKIINKLEFKPFFVKNW